MQTRLRIKELAEEKGVSMTKLHKVSDVAYTTVRKLFRDPYQEVTVTTLSRIAHALGVEIAALLEEVDDSFAEEEKARVVRPK